MLCLSLTLPIRGYVLVHSSNTRPPPKQEATRTDISARSTAWIHAWLARYAPCSMLTSTGLVIFGGTGEQDRFDDYAMLEFSTSDINPCHKCGEPSLNASVCAVSLDHNGYYCSEFVCCAALQFRQEEITK